MLVNLRGRVNNIKLAQQHGLHPLFEAIVNSIHAIEATGRAGRIDVHIRRDGAQRSLDLEDYANQPITAFEILDDGVGFNDENYESFQTSDSMYKATQGGKGIGRLLWLKAFDKAEVTSTYKAADEWVTRTFTFTLDGITDHHLDTAATQEQRTTVRLCSFQEEYRDRTPKAAQRIAKRIIEHCLEYYVLGTVPTINVHEDQDRETYDLQTIYADEIQPHAKHDEFSINERSFRATHLLVGTAYDTHHRIHFCAHKRAVHTEPLDGKLPDLPNTLKDTDKRSFVYAGYVASDFLDESVTPERTSFYGINATPGLTLPGEVAWQAITEAAVERAATFLHPYTTPVREAKEEQIHTFVRSRAPQYRALVKHRPEVIKRIPPNLAPDKLDLELYRHDLAYKADLRAKGQRIIHAVENEPTEPEDFDQQLEQFLEEWNDAGMAELARYIAHRKAILAFLEASIKRQDDGKYQLERALHRVVLPLKTTSDDVPPERMNLWVLDERLVYHHYLASDTPLRRMTNVATIQSSDRPDIVIFNGPAAFVEATPPFPSVTLIEFKRPVRDDYTDEENPISQVYKYVETIRTGKALDRHGRPINIPEKTPFFAYIVCDITPTLTRQARFFTLRQTHDAAGFFGYNESLGVYVEIMSFDKLLGDAKKRNAVLFEKLGIGTP